MQAVIVPVGMMRSEYGMWSTMAELERDLELLLFGEDSRLDLHFGYHMSLQEHFVDVPIS